MNKNYYPRIGLLIALMFAGTGAAEAVPVHPDSGTYLAYTYVRWSTYNSQLSTVIDTLKNDYGVYYLFVNCGSLNSSGQLAGGATQVANAVGLLNTIKTWETANSPHQFRVIAWFAADLTSGDANFVDVSSATVRANIAAESAKLTSTTSTGSYLVGATRTFDGILLDPEPSGGTTAAEITQFNNLKTTMDGIRTATGKITSFAAPQYGTSSSVWVWGPTSYYYMALHVNFIVAMTYDSGSTSGAAYKGWMQNETAAILTAVSGQYWGDPSHPAPTDGVKVILGFPACPTALPSHNALYETIPNAAQGATAGLASVNAAAQGFFQSAAVYLTWDGTGTDGYASFGTDWDNLNLYW